MLSPHSIESSFGVQLLVTHAGYSSFSKATKETFLILSFNFRRIIAGFMIASQLGVFGLVPRAIALFCPFAKQSGTRGRSRAIRRVYGQTAY
jgi:hypothetical protein